MNYFLRNRDIIYDNATAKPTCVTLDAEQPSAQASTKSAAKFPAEPSVKSAAKFQAYSSMKSSAEFLANFPSKSSLKSSSMKPRSKRYYQQVKTHTPANHICDMRVFVDFDTFKGGWDTTQLNNSSMHTRIKVVT